MASSLNGTGVTFNDGTQLNSRNEAGGNYIMRTFTSPTTWTKPAGLKAVKVTVVGGGSGGAGGRAAGPSVPSIVDQPGTGGGVAEQVISAPLIPGPVSVTVGAGGAGGVAPPAIPIRGYSNSGAGGTSSFGSFASATGGGARTFSTNPSFGGTFNISPFSSGVGSGGNRNLFGHAGQLVSRGPAQPTKTGGNPYNIHGGANLPGLNQNGQNADANSGAGGSGANAQSSPNTPARPGGAGGAGIVIVEEFY